jgi:hypothetical protein
LDNFYALKIAFLHIIQNERIYSFWRTSYDSSHWRIADTFQGVPCGKDYFSALLLKACHKKQEKFNPTLEALDGKEP